MQTLSNRKKPLSKKHALRAAQLLEQGWSSHQAGQMHEAESIYKTILKKYPDYADAIHLLGLIAHQHGDYDLAISRFRQALTIKPMFAAAHLNLGDCLQRLGQVEKAIKCFKQALTINPDFAEAYFNLGNSFLIQDKIEDAIANLNKAIHIKPELSQAHFSLGSLFLNIGSINEATYHLEKTINLKPDYAEAYNKLGNAYKEQNKAIENYSCQRQAIHLDRNNNVFWNSFARSLESVSFTTVDDTLWQDISDLLEHPTISPKPFASSIISIIRCHPEFSSSLKTINAEQNNDDDLAAIIKKLSSINVLLKFMSLSSINDLEIESMLTKLRRFLLFNYHNEALDLNQGIPFIAALAIHCFTNEYVFGESTEEKTLLEKLCTEIENDIVNKQSISPMPLMIIAAYKPLHRLSCSVYLSEQDWSEDIKLVIEREVKEPLVELKVRKKIPNLTPIQDTVSLNVRSQYEQNPYPLWVKASLHANNMSIGHFLQASPLRFNLENYSSPENPNILVAGCGTGQHALNTASLFSNSQVLALDLSLTSLAYAYRKTKELGINNIEYAQADLMELDKFDKRFDLIESVGVLHHLENPLEGWKILTRLLNQGGVMKIGLYSEAARPDVVSSRKLIEDKTYSTSADDIRHCRQEIIKLAVNGDKTMEKIFSFSDFFHLSELRDLIFHVQEHRFTIPLIEEHLENLNLKFLGFELKDQNTLTLFKSKFPENNSQTSLKNWHEFEQAYPDSFRGMYQFWLQKT